MDFEATEKYYTDAKQKYEKKGDQIEWENWNRRVKDSAGNWNQNPHDRDTVYPITKYWRLARVKSKDGKEYLETRSMITGVNAYGDEQTNGRVDPEIYTETKWNHRRIADPRDRNNIITESFGIASIKQKHHEWAVFDAEKAKEYYAQKHDDGCVLVLRDDTRDDPPREVLSFEDWANVPFDILTRQLTPTSSSASNEGQQQSRPKAQSR